jgi:hypothetical protein
MALTTVRLLETTIMRNALCLATVLLVAACETTADRQVADANDWVCVREYHVGSKFPVDTCSRRQTEADRQLLIDQFRKTIPPPLGVPQAGGTQ